MKDLYLVRHAKSSWDNPGLEDFDRPLNARGLRDAPHMGKRLKSKNIHPDLMITSPALRALTTCELIAEAMQFPDSHITKLAGLYHADEEDLLDIINGLKDTSQSVMLFGHNPGLSDLANELLDSAVGHIPTCGIVACRFPVDEWKEIDWGSGTLLFFDTPKQPG